LDCLTRKFMFYKKNASMIKKYRGSEMKIFWSIVTLLITALKLRVRKNDRAPVARFALMTDMHYYPASLINPQSKAYKEYLIKDAKLTLESGAVIKAAISDMIKHKVEFVILAGDVSNEGEKLAHIELANMLKVFTKNKIKVFITPGNHDINNNLAAEFLSDSPRKIDTVDEKEFRKIYKNYGFNRAYSTDKETLSYCADIKPKLKIILIDANQYKACSPKPVPDGILSEDTIAWAENEIRLAIENGNRIIGVMHHGLLEHFPDQGKTFSAFLVRDFQKIAARFAHAGLEFVFTGHLHAQDISSVMFDDHTIYDIETAALTSAPFAWRLLNLKIDELDIKTIYIEDIDFDYGENTPFREWAMSRVWQGLLQLESHFLRNHNGLNAEQTKIAAPYYARAFLAHFCGDEKPTDEDMQFYEKHRNNPNSPFYKIAQIFSSLWTDLPAGDNSLSIPLKKTKTR
jgi:3',5'-cyclic AMP phosphodiesterase CpdA